MRGLEGVGLGEGVGVGREDVEGEVVAEGGVPVVDGGVVAFAFGA